MCTKTKWRPNNIIVKSVSALVLSNNICILHWAFCVAEGRSSRVPSVYAPVQSVHAPVQSIEYERSGSALSVLTVFNMVRSLYHQVFCCINESSVMFMELKYPWVLLQLNLYAQNVRMKNYTNYILKDCRRTRRCVSSMNTTDDSLMQQITHW